MELGRRGLFALCYLILTKKWKAEKPCVCVCVQATVCACAWEYTRVYEREGQGSVLGVILKQAESFVLSDRTPEPHCSSWTS